MWKSLPVDLRTPDISLDVFKRQNVQNVLIRESRLSVDSAFAALRRLQKTPGIRNEMLDYRRIGLLKACWKDKLSNKTVRDRDIARWST